MTLLDWCVVGAISAAGGAVCAAWQPRHRLLRMVWSALLLVGEVLPLLLLPLAWQHIRYVIPFLGPPVRIGMLPMWWTLAGIALGYGAAAIDTVRVRAPWWQMALPPLHSVFALKRLWNR